MMGSAQRTGLEHRSVCQAGDPDGSGPSGPVAERRPARPRVLRRRLRVRQQAAIGAQLGVACAVWLLTPPAEAIQAPNSPAHPARTSEAPSDGDRTPPAAAEPAAVADPDAGSAEVLRRFRGSTFDFVQSATGTTVGIGQDVLTRNPTYEMTFSLSPRYYLYRDADQAISLRGNVALFREFTDSDLTTRRGEWSLTDTVLLAAYGRGIYQSRESSMDVLLRAPELTFPTSVNSWSNGTLLGLGASAGVLQRVRLFGSDAPALQSLLLLVNAGYQYLFTEATVPTNPDLQRVRMTPEGTAVPGDQLSGVPFAPHQAFFSGSLTLALTPRVFWTTTAGFRPAWRYQFDSQTCIVVANDCVVPDTREDATNYSVITQFGSSLSVLVLDELTVRAGYDNLALQLGPDGQRRSLFYSPEARVFLALTLMWTGPSVGRGGALVQGLFR